MRKNILIFLVIMLSVLCFGCKEKEQLTIINRTGLPITELRIVDELSEREGKNLLKEKLLNGDETNVSVAFSEDAPYGYLITIDDCGDVHFVFIKPNDILTVYLEEEDLCVAINQSYEEIMATEDDDLPERVIHISDLVGTWHCEEVFYDEMRINEDGTFAIYADNELKYSGMITETEDGFEATAEDDEFSCEMIVIRGYIYMDVFGWFSEE